MLIRCSKCREYNRVEKLRGVKIGSLVCEYCGHPLLEKYKRG